MNTGTLEIIIGPMFSGKTTELNKRLLEAREMGQKVLKLFHFSDLARIDIYNHNNLPGQQNQGSTHNLSYNSLPDDIRVIATPRLDNIDVTHYDVIGVDEGQFFDDLEIVDLWANAGKRVIVTGLDGDAQQQPFGKTLTLIPKSDSCVKLTAICRKCIQEQQQLGSRFNINNFRAPFTVKLNSDMDQVQIGGPEIYIATCRRHRQMSRRG